MQTVYKFPPYTFLDEFTPLESADASSSSNHPTQPPCKRQKQAVDFDEVDPEGSSESWAYSFVDAFNDQLLCPDHTLVMTYDEEDGKEITFGALYDDGDDIPEQCSEPQWGLIQACVLFFEPGDDPCASVSNPDDTSDASLQRQETLRSYVSSFTARVLSRQHHAHLFLILVFGTSARIVRADREAFFTTFPFEYKMTPDWSILRAFLHRFTAMNNAGRGMDPTVRLLTPGDGSSGVRRAFMQRMARRQLEGAADHARECFAESLDTAWPWYSVTVEAQEFLIAKPRVYSDKPARAARGYVALGYTSGSTYGQFVWLKDTWRRVLDGEYEQEGAVLHDLNRLEVPNIPTLVCHEDVADHQLNLAQILDRLYRRKVARGRSRAVRIHYRVVTAEVGLPLAEFRNSQQLTTVFLDCIVGHREAYARASILHRDVSEGNILMVPCDVEEDGEAFVEHRGLLIDWEYAERTSRRALPGFSYRAIRRGTCAYLSVGAMNHTKVPVTPADDLESFFHVYVELALAYLRHNCVDPARFDTEYFAGTKSASALKERCVRLGQLFLSVLGDNKLRFLKETKRKPSGSRTVITALVAHPIQRLLDSWLVHIRDRYTKSGQDSSSTAASRLSFDRENVGNLDGGSPRKAPAPRVQGPLTCLELNMEVPCEIEDEALPDNGGDDKTSHLAGYDVITGLLSDVLETSFWPCDDKTRDQLESDDEGEVSSASAEESLDDEARRPNGEEEGSRPSKRRRIK